MGDATPGEAGACSPLQRAGGRCGRAPWAPRTLGNEAEQSPPPPSGQVRSGSQLEDGARLRMAGHHTAKFPAAPSPKAVEPSSGEDGKPDTEVCTMEAGEPRSRR